MQNNTPTKAQDRVYAGFFVRLAAYLIDWLIVGAVLLVVRIPMWIASLAGGAEFMFQDFIFTYSAYDILIYVLKVGYFIVMTYLTGATVGKKLLQIKVVSAEDRKPTFFEIAFRESVGKFLSGLILYVGYFIIGADKDKKGLHDILSDTRVIYYHKKTIVIPPPVEYRTIRFGSMANPNFTPTQNRAGQGATDQNGLNESASVQSGSGQNVMNQNEFNENASYQNGLNQSGLNDDFAWKQQNQNNNDTVSIQSSTEQDRIPAQNNFADNPAWSQNGISPEELKRRYQQQPGMVQPTQTENTDPFLSAPVSQTDNPADYQSGSAKTMSLETNEETGQSFPVEDTFVPEQNVSLEANEETKQSFRAEDVFVPEQNVPLEANEEAEQSFLEEDTFAPEQNVSLESNEETGQSFPAEDTFASEQKVSSEAAHLPEDAGSTVALGQQGQTDLQSQSTENRAKTVVFKDDFWD